MSALLVGDMMKLLMSNIGSFAIVGASIGKFAAAILLPSFKVRLTTHHAFTTGERWDSFESSLERIYSGLKLMCLGRHLEPSQKITFPAIRMVATVNQVKSMSTLSMINSFFSKGSFIPSKWDIDCSGELRPQYLIAT